MYRRSQPGIYLDDGSAERAIIAPDNIQEWADHNATATFRDTQNQQLGVGLALQACSRMRLGCLGCKGLGIPLPGQTSCRVGSWLKHANTHANSEDYTSGHKGRHLCVADLIRHTTMYDVSLRSRNQAINMLNIVVSCNFSIRGHGRPRARAGATPGGAMHLCWGGCRNYRRGTRDGAWIGLAGAQRPLW